CAAPTAPPPTDPGRGAPAYEAPRSPSRAARPRDSSAEALEELLLVDDLDPERLGFRELRSGVLAGHHEARLLGDARRHARARLLGSLLRLVAAQRLEAPRQDDGQPRQRTLRKRRDLVVLGPHAGLGELGQELHVLLVVEPLVDAARDLGPD